MTGGQRHLSSLQWMVLALCTSVIVLDGLDVQLIFFAGSEIARTFSMSDAELSLIFSIGLVGMFFGNLLIGPLGDRYGRKTAIQLSATLFSIFTFACAFAPNWQALLVFRLIAGIGMGGAIPNAAVLMAEYAPPRLRGLLISIVFVGMPIGGILGGTLAAWIIPVHGWQYLFIIGGLLPLAVVAAQIFLLPESVKFLCLGNARQQEKARQILLRLPGVQMGEESAGRVVRRASPLALFSDGRRRDTLGLWAVFFLIMMVLYFLLSWIPTLLVKESFSFGNAAITSVIMNFGGIVGAIAIGRFIDRAGTRPVIAGAFFLAAVFTAIIGTATVSLPLTMGLALIVGFFVMGAMIGMNIYVSLFYPTEIRATGLGWAFGIGRLGAILGPVLGGVMLSLGLPLWGYFLVFGLTLAGAGLVFRRQRFQAPPARVETP